MRIFPFLFPRYTWHKPKQDKVIYLTFDDGPIPEVTEWVLDMLRQHQVKATFFCIGDNISKHPVIFQRILAEQHQIGNHTFHHLKGWKTEIRDYIADVEQCQQEIVKHAKATTSLFRPPYGKITKKQANYILDKGYEIIMWSILTKDYSSTISPERCLARTIRQLVPGSIIVFHDSLKAEKNMKYTLPLLIEYLKKEGYFFATL
ncbi:polysaccharide deacetylase family protein [Myroides fluvii]|uniref:polysaccharide deacetylase family protein n=1 Tax=Myroides fluvii TaxID=2572594 RepID=UPI00131E0253|nr:polysaccharide deacetylase family protein [Myroides fluvii]